MKKLLLLFLIAVISSCNTKETVDVPEVIQSSFKADYPNALEIEWEMEDSNFEVEFTQDQTKREILYSPNGEILSNSIDIQIEELPSSIKMTIENEYAGAKILEVERIESGSSKYFEVEISNSDEELTLYFDRQGIRVNPEVNDF